MAVFSSGPTGIFHNQRLMRIPGSEDMPAAALAKEIDARLGRDWFVTESVVMECKESGEIYWQDGAWRFIVDFYGM